MREQEVCVLHVAASQDRDALETLCQTTQVLSALGVAQVLLVLGQGEHGIGSASPAAEVRPLRFAGVSFFGRIRILQLELAQLARERSLYAVHLHGIAACLLGARALKATWPQGRVLYSPHLPEHASPWTTALLGRLVQRHLDSFDGAAVTASLADAQPISKLLKRSAEVLPHPVSAAFFEAARLEGAPPAILADGSGSEAVNLVSRLCVLLNGRDARIPFSWLGAPDARVRPQLAAAGVRVLALQGDALRAQAFSRASAFVHLSPAGGVPVAVAQAMAAGVPCLVSDTPAHRALIRHGETGFICTSERDLLEKLVFLLRDRSERWHIGEAARAEAARRFTLQHFERAILRIYGFARSGAFASRTAGGLGPLPASQGTHAH